MHVCGLLFVPQSLTSSSALLRSCFCHMSGVRKYLTHIPSNIQNIICTIWKFPPMDIENTLETSMHSCWPINIMTKIQLKKDNWDYIEDNLISFSTGLLRLYHLIVIFVYKPSRYSYCNFYSSACQCECDILHRSRSRSIIELHGPHMWLKLHNEPGVEFHQKLRHIHPKSCSVMQILHHLNSFILAVGFAIEKNVIACPPHTHTHTHTHTHSCTHTLLGERKKKKKREESSGTHSFITQTCCF